MSKMFVGGNDITRGIGIFSNGIDIKVAYYQFVGVISF